MSMRRSMQLPLASCPSTTDSSLPVCWYCTATLPCCLYCTALCCLVAYIARLYVALLPTLHGSILPCCLHCTAVRCLVACIARHYVALLFGNAIGQDEKCMCASCCISLVTHFCFSHVCHFCFSHVSHQFILSNKKTGWQLHEKKMQSDCWWHAADFAEQFVLNNFGAQDKVDLGEQCPEHF